MLRLRRSQSISTAGFSLPELLVVMVMASVLALIATPSWISALNNRRASAVRDEITQTIRLAQSQAQRDRTIRTVTLLTNANPPTIEAEGNGAQSLGGDGVPANILSVRTSVGTSADGLTVVPGGNTLTLRYNETGALESLPGADTVITVTVGNSRRCVRVENLLGTLRTLDGNDCPS